MNGEPNCIEHIYSSILYSHNHYGKTHTARRSSTAENARTKAKSKKQKQKTKVHYGTYDQSNANRIRQLACRLVEQ